MKRRFPDAASTAANVKEGVLDESYLAVSPFEIDEAEVRRGLRSRRTDESTRASEAKRERAGAPTTGRSEKASRGA